MRIYKILKIINSINENRKKLKEIESLFTFKDPSFMCKVNELDSDYVSYTEELNSSLGFSIEQKTITSEEFLKDINEINEIYLKLIDMIDCFDAYDDPTCAPNFQSKVSLRLEKLSENFLKKYSNK